jgi:hypothetical protein
MRTLVLNRLLVFIFFLDRARKARPRQVTLLLQDAKVKSSRELLLFCRQFLSVVISSNTWVVLVSKCFTGKNQ